MTDRWPPGRIAVVIAALVLPVGVGAALAWTRRPRLAGLYIAATAAVLTTTSCFDLLRHQGVDPVPWGALVLANLIVDTALAGVVVGIGCAAGTLARHLTKDGRD